MQLRQNYRNFWHTDLMGTIQADTPCILSLSLSLSLLLSLCTNTDMHCFVYMYVCMCMEFLFCWYGCVFLCVCLCRLLLCVFLVSAISISWIWISSLNLWISIVLWISEFLRSCFDFDLVLTLVDFVNSFWSLWKFLNAILCLLLWWYERMVGFTDHGIKRPIQLNCYIKV